MNLVYMHVKMSELLADQVPLQCQLLVEECIRIRQFSYRGGLLKFLALGQSCTLQYLLAVSLCKIENYLFCINKSDQNLQI